MKHFPLLLLLTCFLPLKSCLFSRCEIVSIPDEHKLWLNLYEENDTLIFESNLGSYDTLVMTEIESDISPCNKFELGRYQYEWQSLFLRSTFSDRTLFLRISSDNINCLEFKGHNYCARDSSFVAKDQFPSNDSEHNIEKYYYIDSSRLNDYYKNRIDAFAISNKVGLVKFSTPYGEIFSLFKHISSSKK